MRAQVAHRQPFHHQFAYVVYVKNGLTLREIAVRLGLNYDQNVQRRAARTVARINRHLELVRVSVDIVDGRRMNRYWRTDPSLSGVEVRRILREKEGRDEQDEA